MPLVSDVRAIAQTIALATTALKQYERDSGRVVRRRYEFPVEESYSTSAPLAGTQQVVLPGNTGGALDAGAPTGNAYRESTTYRRTWFSGAFTYHLPSDYRSRNELMKLGARADALLGIDLTPEVLWNVTPWSWAVDWFSNAGDVISNLSDWATDGLVLRYGYIMEHSFVKNTYRYTGTGRLQQPKSVFPSPVTAISETKRRLRASPFGFGVDWSGLSPFQLSIAAALGLSKTPWLMFHLRHKRQRGT